MDFYLDVYGILKKKDRQKQRDKKRILDSLKLALIETRQIGLKFRKVEIVEAEENENDWENLEVKIYDKSELKKLDPVRVLKAKDQAFLSDKNYCIFKKTAELNDLPTLSEITKN